MDERGDRSNNVADGPQFNLYPRLIINGDAPPVNPVLNAGLEPIEFLVDVGLVNSFGSRRHLLQQLTIQPVNATNNNNNVVDMDDDNAEVPLEDFNGGSSSEDDKDGDGDTHKMRWWDEFLDSESADSDSDTDDFGSTGSSLVDCMDVHPDHTAGAAADWDYCKHFAGKGSPPGEYETSCEDEGEHKA